MAKKDCSNIFSGVIKIFFNGLKLYFLNFEKFFKYMAFPVFGQIIGITIVFAISYVFTLYVPALTTKTPVFDNIPLVFAILALLMLPGFFVFCKAFWEYLIAMASLNSMASTLLEGGKLDDLSVHSELIKRRSGSYIWFLLLISLIYLVLSIPILWGLFAIAFVYLALSFQVFALEEEKSAFGAIKSSINHVKFNFFKTALLLILLGVVTYWLVPGLICWGFETGGLTQFFSYPVEQYIKMLPIKEFNEMFAQAHIPYTIKSYTIAQNVVFGAVSFAVTAFTLPLRSICCTNLYKEINKKNYAGKIAAEKLAHRAKSTSKNKRNIEDDED